jgi:hypothetical protein
MRNHLWLALKKFLPYAKKGLPANPAITRPYPSWAFLPVCMILLTSLAACTFHAPPAELPKVDTATDMPVPDSSPSPLPGPTLTPSPTLTKSPTLTLTATPPFTASDTPTMTLTPTYAILRGEVLERANCRYGPGYPYLYKYGLVAGSNLEIIGRTDLGNWLLIRAIGGSNPCWVKASLMDVNEEVMSVAPTYIPLPQSPYYVSPTGVTARRDRDVVTISWNPLNLRAGDDSEWFPYVVEAWVCQAGRLNFTPLGSYTTSVTVIDESGCSATSHARLVAAEKHGYTRPVEILWPAAGK